MGSVGAPVVRRIVEVARDGDVEDLLSSVGLDVDVSGVGSLTETVDEEAYYGLLERVAATDVGLPFRYATALQVDDLGALGLAMKTARDLHGALQRLARYVLVLSDTLEYELVDESSHRVFALTGRPPHRRGAALANECALAAVTSMARQVTGSRVAPLEVTFRHTAPSDVSAHQRFFGCEVGFDAHLDGIRFGDDRLALPALLADEGLSSYLLAELDAMRERSSPRSLVARVVGAVADALPDGRPSKAQVARRLHMSERTLQRRLAEQGDSFQDVVARTRRAAATSLLAVESHSLADVAFLTGFSDQTSFTRAFKRWTGETPAAFRRRVA